MRVVAGDARVEVRELLEGTALTPLLHGSSLVHLVADDDEFLLHVSSLGLEDGGLDPYCSNVAEVFVQHGASREGLQNRDAATVSSANSYSSCALMQSSWHRISVTTRAPEVRPDDRNHVLNNNKHDDRRNAPIQNVVTAEKHQYSINDNNNTLDMCTW